MSDGAFEQMYREIILDHYKNPRGHGVLEGADAEAEGQNPLCGDEVSIYVAFGEDGETIEELKFSGRGCARFLSPRRTVIALPLASMSPCCSKTDPPPGTRLRRCCVRSGLAMRMRFAMRSILTMNSWRAPVS